MLKLAVKSSQIKKIFVSPWDTWGWLRTRCNWLFDCYGLIRGVLVNKNKQKTILLVLRAWSPVCGTILGASGNFRIWDLSRGNKYLGVGLYWRLGIFHSSLNPSCPSTSCFHQDASKHTGQVPLYWTLWNAGLKYNISSALSHSIRYSVTAVQKKQFL